MKYILFALFSCCMLSVHSQKPKFFNNSRTILGINKERTASMGVGDIDNDGKPDLVHSFEKAKGEKEGIYWLSYKNIPIDSDWQWHTISGPLGIKYDKIELVDLDGDGDLDVLTCEENYGIDSKGLGVIWYENPIK